MLMRITLGLITILLSSALVAQPTAIRAGRLLDVSSGEVLNDQIIIIENQRISSIAPADSISVPDTAVVIDLGEHTVLPGLIDAHVHLTSDATIQGYDSLGQSSVREALFGVRAARDTLLAGFTTVRNLGAGGYGDVALRDAIADGDFPGPRMLVSGPALGITGGHCDSNLLPHDFQYSADGVADGPWAVRRQVRLNNKYGVDVIKFCATGGVMSRNTNLNAQQFTDGEMAAIVDEAHMLGLKVAAHAHGTGGIKAAIRAGVDSVEHASLLDDEAIAMALEVGTTLVMDVYVSDYILSLGRDNGMLEESLAKEREVGARQRESFRRAVAAGVNVVFGSDAGVYEHGLNGRQFAFMQEFGMGPLQAIQAATVGAAGLLGIESEAGQIRPGFYADIIAVSGDPLDNVRELENIDFVMKAGAVVKDTR